MDWSKNSRKHELSRSILEYCGSRNRTGYPWFFLVPLYLSLSSGVSLFSEEKDKEKEERERGENRRTTRGEPADSGGIQI
jgi:hypothetical protein